MANLERKITKKQWHSGKVGCWLHQRSFLVIIWDYRIQGKNVRLHLQTHSNLLPLLFAFSHQNYVRYLTQHHVELTNLSFTKPHAFSDLEMFWRKNSDVTACWSVLGSSYFVILREHPLRTVINSQTFLGRKSRKIWNRDLSKYFELFDVSYYKGVQLILTWNLSVSIVLENLCDLKLMQ